MQQGSPKYKSQQMPGKKCINCVHCFISWLLKQRLTAYLAVKRQSQAKQARSAPIPKHPLHTGQVNSQRYSRISHAVAFISTTSKHMHAPKSRTRTYKRQRTTTYCWLHTRSRKIVARKRALAYTHPSSSEKSGRVNIAINVIQINLFFDVFHSAFHHAFWFLVLLAEPSEAEWVIFACRPCGVDRVDSIHIDVRCFAHLGSCFVWLGWLGACYFVFWVSP